ncbi:MAG: homocysteine S-methyltransferase family protein [Elusimicrobiota bacterium]
MKTLLERLRAKELLVADGAMGTQLFARGLKQGDCPEAMNLSSPEVLEEIARDYAEAGAQIVQTNTFGGSAVKLADYDLQDKTAEINTRAVEAARKGVAGRALISGSCGPSGKILKPYGDAEPDVLRAGFEKQMRALVDAGVDLLCIETMTDLNEALLALEAAKSVAGKIPAVATMTFDRTKKGFRTIMGVSIEQAADKLAAAGADVLGTNCGNGVDAMIEIIAEFKKQTALPLLVQSNAGIPKMDGASLVYAEGPEFFKEKTPALINAGAAVIGGCCGTTPEHIRAVRERVDALRTAAS